MKDGSASISRLYLGTCGIGLYTLVSILYGMGHLLGWYHEGNMSMPT
jgi:hypothetical protein